jgi:hypothetical protein
VQQCKQSHVLDSRHQNHVLHTSKSSGYAALITLAASYALGKGGACHCRRTHVECSHTPKTLGIRSDIVRSEAKLGLVSPCMQNGLVSDDLCEDCSRVDLSYVSAHQVERRNIGTLAQVWERRTWCTFCRLICAAYCEHIGEPSYEQISPAPGFVEPRFCIGSRISKRKDSFDIDACALQIELFLAVSDDPQVLTTPFSCLDIVRGHGSRSLKYDRREMEPHCDIQLLQGWIEECTHDHDHSKSVVRSLEPLLVDRCLRGLRVDTLKITTLSPGDRYFTLSYVCGEVPRTALSARVCKGGDTYVIPEALPQVIQDALRLARQLGVEYLWYVFLCPQYAPNGMFNNILVCKDTHC